MRREHRSSPRPPSIAADPPETRNPTSAIRRAHPRRRSLPSQLHGMPCLGRRLRRSGATRGAAPHPAIAIQSAEVVRVGPGQIPEFGVASLTEGQVASVVASARYLDHPNDRGGRPLLLLGPVADGATALLRLACLIGVTLWIGSRECSVPRSRVTPMVAQVKVLVALDGSPVSMHAGREAVRLFARAGVEFLVINVARTPTSWINPTGFGGVAAMPTLDLEQLAEPSESDVGATAIRAGIDDAEVLTDVGDPVECICAAAEDHDVDVVVVGSHDRGVLSRLINPSVAAGVVRGTFRPVLVVGGTPPKLTGATR